jgi:hypothetical protein
MASSREVTAVCESERHGGWRATVPELGCEAHAKRLDQLKERIALEVHEHTGIELCEVVVRLEGVFPEALRRFEEAHLKMSEATRLRDEASSEIRHVVGELRKENLTMRDIAALLGISPQRVAQLVSEAQTG